MTTTEIKKQISEAIRNAPVLSATAHQLLQVTADPNHELKDVIALVKCDSFITARVLRVVNSAAMALLYPITSVDRAVSHLGSRMIVGIAVSECSSELFGKPLEGYEGTAGQLWRHELFSAVASRAVARHAKNSLEVDLAFTAGLLHDIGKTILSSFLRGTSRSAVRDIYQGTAADYLQVEQTHLGLDHAGVGFELAEHWNLPETLRQVIRHHHHPEQADPANRALVYAVHLGDILAMMGGQGTGSDTMHYNLDQGYADYFNISNDELAALLLETTEEFNKIEASLADTKEQ